MTERKFEVEVLFTFGFTIPHSRRRARALSSLCLSPRLPALSVRGERGPGARAALALCQLCATGIARGHRVRGVGGHLGPGIDR